LCSPKIKIHHLKLFLKSQYASANPSAQLGESAINVVYVNPRGVEHALHGNKTLLDVVEEFKAGDLDSDLVLHYRIARDL